MSNNTYSTFGVVLSDIGYEYMNIDLGKALNDSIEQLTRIWKDETIVASVNNAVGHCKLFIFCIAFRRTVHCVSCVRCFRDNTFALLLAVRGKTPVRPEPKISL